MTVLPPIPEDFPEIGSRWYCYVDAWPGTWQLNARKGSQIVIDYPRYINGNWKITFTSYIRSDYFIVGCSIAPEDFSSVFQEAPLLTLARTIWTSVWGTIYNPTPLPDLNEG